MNSWFAKWGMIYPVHLLRCEWVPFHLSEIRACDQLSKFNLHRYQEAKLTKLLKWVYYNEPYYRQILTEMGASTYLDRPFVFFDRFPFLTKEIVRQTANERNPPRWKRLDFRSTSGSTGLPISFYKDRLATGYMEAVQNHVYTWHSIGVGEPQARFWGMPPGLHGVLAQLKDMLKNRIRFSAFDLSDEAKYLFYNRIVKFQPSYLYGYSSLILEFANFMEREKLLLDEVQLKAVIGTGEYVYEHERRSLEQAFGVSFVSEYGCSEIGLIGFDCPCGKMHQMSANILLEIIDGEGRPVPDGEMGEIVVTELNARHFPFIRYRLGDRGRYLNENCLCGRTLPTIQIAAGRKDDYIITPEGRKVYDAILAYTLKKGIVQFKAVQDSVDQLQIFVVSDSQFDETLEQEYVTRLKQAISPAMRITFKRVSAVRRESSGKLRYFISKVAGGRKCHEP